MVPGARNILGAHELDFQSFKQICCWRTIIALSSNFQQHLASVDAFEPAPN
jgi:hypothetical protein